MRLLKFVAFSVFVLTVISSTHLSAKPDVKVKSIALGGGVHMLVGQGGNIGVFAGPDGIFMIDSQFKALGEKLSQAIRNISDKPIKFVLNTHWHFDHVDGNEIFAKKGAVIIAHEHVRKLMTKNQVLKAFNKKVPAAPKSALPAITFTSDLTFHMNDETIKIFHVSNAHTGGDSVIHFVKADVIHMGDTYFSGIYPFIDFQHGGGLDGMITAVNRVLAISGPNTKIIPGHGPLSNRANLKRYRHMLVTVRNRMAAAIKAGKSLPQLSKKSPIAEFDKEWGDGFLKPAKFLELIYKGMKQAAN